MNDISTSYGYAITNPVDRFLLLARTIYCHANHHSNFMLKEGKIRWLAESLWIGAFDFCGKPNESQRAFRKKECTWLVGFVSVLENHPDDYYVSRGL